MINQLSIDAEAVKAVVIMSLCNCQFSFVCFLQAAVKSAAVLWVISRQKYGYNCFKLLFVTLTHLMQRFREKAFFILFETVSHLTTPQGTSPGDQTRLRRVCKSLKNTGNTQRVFTETKHQHEGVIWEAKENWKSKRTFLSEETINWQKLFYFHCVKLIEHYLFCHHTVFVFSLMFDP